MSSRKKVAVLGAGAVGLSSAINIQVQTHCSFGYQVRIQDLCMKGGGASEILPTSRIQSGADEENLGLEIGGRGGGVRSAPSFIL